MAPRLAIPVTANLDEFKSKMSEAANQTGSAARKIADQFQTVNRAITSGAEHAAARVGSAWAASAASVALRWGAAGIAIIGTIKLIGNVVGEAREQIREMVAIADKASARGVSPEFFQAFTAAAKGAADQVKVLEDALANAFRAQQPQLDTQASVVLPERLKQAWTDAEIASTRAVQAMQTASAALILSATTADERTKAVLVTMKELEASGQRLEARNLGEKFFGREFQNNIDTGKLKIDDLLRTIEGKLAGTQGRLIFSNEAVKQAKDLDVELNNAWHTINENLAPSFTLLGDIALAIKATWIGIVQLMAQASNLLPKFQQKGGRFIGPSGDTDFMLPPGEQTGAIGQNTPPQVTVQKPGLPRLTVEDVRRAIGPTPPQKEEAATKGAFESQVESINKHIAALEADAAAVGKTAAAHAVLRAELSLLQAIEREGGDITNEQITKYAELRKTMEPLQAMQAAGIKLSEEQAKAFEQVTKRLGEAATKADSAKAAFAALNEAIQFGGKQLVDIFDALTDKTKDFGETMKSVLAAVKRAFLEAVIAGQGPLAGLLGTKTAVPGGTGGLLGDLGSLFATAPGKAAGGPVRAGRAYKVGEAGPEFFIPQTDGQIVANGRIAESPIPSGVRSTGGGAGGSFNVVVENHGADVQQQGQRRNASGGFDFRIAVRSIVQESFADSSMDSSMRRFGAFPQAVTR
jgi:hypothetical protein